MPENRSKRFSYESALFDLIVARRIALDLANGSAADLAKERLKIVAGLIEASLEKVCPFDADLAGFG